MSVGPIPDITGGLTVGVSGSLADPNLRNNYGPPRLPLGHPGASCYAQDTPCCQSLCTWNGECCYGNTMCGTGGTALLGLPTPSSSCTNQNCGGCSTSGSTTNISPDKTGPCPCCCNTDSFTGAAIAGPGSSVTIALFAGGSGPRPGVFSTCASGPIQPHSPLPGFGPSGAPP